MVIMRIKQMEENQTSKVLLYLMNLSWYFPDQFKGKISCPITCPMSLLLYAIMVIMAKRHGNIFTVIALII